MIESVIDEYKTDPNALAKATIVEIKKSPESLDLTNDGEEELSSEIQEAFVNNF